MLMLNYRSKDFELVMYDEFPPAIKKKCIYYKYPIMAVFGL